MGVHKLLQIWPEWARVEGKRLKSRRKVNGANDGAIGVIDGVKQGS
jgi:hypothetical protein